MTVEEDQPPPPPAVYINEIMASNRDGLVDADGDWTDWIELRNGGKEAVSLKGWHLSDDSETPSKWVFPNVQLGAGDFLLVFASGKDRRSSGEELHTNFKLKSSGEPLFLTQPRDKTHYGFPDGFPQQFVGVSYGSLEEDKKGYLKEATPRSNNGDAYPGVVADVRLTQTRCCFSTPFELSLSCETPETEIRYTLDGTSPTSASGEIYRKPLAVNRTTHVTVAAFREGFLSMPPKSHTYIHIPSVVHQPDVPVGYPSEWRDGDSTLPADYEMDPEVVKDGTYAPLIDGALTSVGSLSIVLPIGSLFDHDQGIYMNPLERGHEWERRASVNYIPPAEERAADPGFSAVAGLRIHGGSSRAPKNSPKHSFRLNFKKEYGDAKLRHALFDGPGPDEYNSLVLRAGYNYSWIHPNHAISGDQRRHGMYIRDEWVRTTFREMGQEAPRGKFVHLYLNGLYWGLYNLVERPDADFFAAREKGTYEVIKEGSASSGTTEAWDVLMEDLNTDGMLVDHLPSIRERVDFENFSQYYALNMFIGNHDWATTNYYAVRNTSGNDRRWRIFPWDSEFCLDGNISFRASDRGTKSAIGALVRNFGRHVDVRQALSDAVQPHFMDGNALSPERCRERWDRLASEVELAVIAESARWGDHREGAPKSNPEEFPYTRNKHWNKERRYIDNYFRGRTDMVKSHLVSYMFLQKTHGPYLDPVEGEQQIKSSILTNPGPVSSIYYTLDGSDPRLPGGDFNPDATMLAPGQGLEFQHAGEGELFARIFSKRTGWSPPAKASGVRFAVVEEEVAPESIVDPETGESPGAAKVAERQLQLAESHIRMLVHAISEFEKETVYPPVPEGATGDFPTNATVIDILTGRDLERNLWGKDYLRAKRAIPASGTAPARGGLVSDSSGGQSLVDPWGNPYMVRVGDEEGRVKGDERYHGYLVIPPGEDELHRPSWVVWSYGPPPSPNNHITAKSNDPDEYIRSWKVDQK